MKHAKSQTVYKSVQRVCVWALLFFTAGIPGLTPYPCDAKINTSTPLLMLYKGGLDAFFIEDSDETLSISPDAKSAESTPPPVQNPKPKPRTAAPASLPETVTPLPEQPDTAAPKDEMVTPVTIQAEAPSEPAPKTLKQPPVSEVLPSKPLQYTLVQPDEAIKYSDRFQVASPAREQIIIKDKLQVKGINRHLTPTFINGKKITVHPDGRFLETITLGSMGRHIVVVSFLTPDNQIYNWMAKVIRMDKPENRKLNNDERDIPLFMNSKFVYAENRDLNTNEPITRSELAFFIARLHNVPLLPTRTAPFSDLPASHWAAPSVRYCVDKEIMKEFPGGNFNPDRPVTRLEYVITMCRAFRLTPSKEAGVLPFKDIDPEDWTARYIRLALDKNLIADTSPIFNKEQALTRKEFIQFIRQLPEVKNQLMMFADFTNGFEGMENLMARYNGMIAKTLPVTQEQPAAAPQAKATERTEPVKAAKQAEAPAPGAKKTAAPAPVEKQTASHAPKTEPAPALTAIPKTDKPAPKIWEESEEDLQLEGTGLAIKPSPGKATPARTPKEKAAEKPTVSEKLRVSDSRPKAETPPNTAGQTLSGFQLDAKVKNGIVYDAEFQLSGRTEPNSELTIRQSTVSADQKGRFATTVQLSPGKNTIFISQNQQQSKVVVYLVTGYADLNTHWIKESAAKLRTAGILDKQTELKPKQAVTRVELARILQRIYSYKQPEPVQYIPDIEDTDADYAAIQAVVSQGVIQLEENSGCFRPSTAMSRAQVMVALIRTIHPEVPKTYSGRLKFRDLAQKPWAKPYIAVALEYNILSPARRFYPDRLMTREELIPILMKTPVVKKLLETEFNYD